VHLGTCTVTLSTMHQITIKTPNSKCRLFLIIHLYRDLAADVYLSEAPSRPMTPNPPPPPIHTVYAYTVYLFTQGRGEEGELTREKVTGAMLHKAGRQYQHD
jgi:hypothetical protein